MVPLGLITSLVALLMKRYGPSSVETPGDDQEGDSSLACKHESPYGEDKQHDTVHMPVKQRRNRKYVRAAGKPFCAATKPHS